MVFYISDRVTLINEKGFILQSRNDSFYGSDYSEYFLVNRYPSIFFEIDLFKVTRSKNKNIPHKSKHSKATDLF